MKNLIDSESRVKGSAWYWARLQTGIRGLAVDESYNIIVDNPAITVFDHALLHVKITLTHLGVIRVNL